MSAAAVAAAVAAAATAALDVFLTVATSVSFCDYQQAKYFCSHLVLL